MNPSHSQLTNPKAASFAFDGAGRYGARKCAAADDHLAKRPERHLGFQARARVLCVDERCHVVEEAAVFRFV